MQPERTSKGSAFTTETPLIIPLDLQSLDADELELDKRVMDAASDIAGEFPAVCICAISDSSEKYCN